MENRECPVPASTTREIEFGQGRIKIGADLDNEISKGLKNLFVWELKDLIEVDWDLAEHRLNVTPGSDPPGKAEVSDPNLQVNFLA